MRASLVSGGADGRAGPARVEYKWHFGVRAVTGAHPAWYRRPRPATEAKGVGMPLLVSSGVTGVVIVAVALLVAVLALAVRRNHAEKPYGRR